MMDKVVAYAFVGAYRIESPLQPSPVLCNIAYK